MSRLESNAEPSMEEILASIRRIIAEEPAGSRPKPSSPSPRGESPLTPAPAPQRGFMSREAFVRSSQPAEPETSERYFTPISPPSSEPTQDDVTANGQSLSSPHNDHAGSSTGRARSSGLLATDPAPGRSSGSNSGAGESSRVIEAEAKRVSAADLQSDTASIDAQLVRLLDDDLNAALREAEGSLALAADDDEARDRAADAPAADVRANFPASRGSYTNGAATNDTAEVHDSSDPFAFDLGPSPFQKSAPEPIAVDRRPAPAAETREPPSAPAAPSGPASTPVHSASQIFANPVSAAPGPSPSPAPAPSLSAALASAPRSGTPFAVPSVAATIGPYRSLEPLSASFRQAADDRDARAASSPETPAAADASRNALSRTDARHERFDRLDPTLPDAVPLSSSSAPAAGETSADRAMEDAVADLLRPLLKTWLAENMPKIVERALRREITERLMPPSAKNNSD